MTTRTWKHGSPPHIGWWQVSRDGLNVDVWRWWNGKEWSLPVHASSVAPMPTYGVQFRREQLMWSDYWPADARVPRLDPTDGHWTFTTPGVRPSNLPRTIEVHMRDGRLIANAEFIGVHK